MESTRRYPDLQEASSVGCHPRVCCVLALDAITSIFANIANAPKCFSTSSPEMLGTGRLRCRPTMPGDIAERNSLVSDRDRVPRSGVRVTFDAGLIML